MTVSEPPEDDPTTATGGFPAVDAGPGGEESAARGADGRQPEAAVVAETAAGSVVGSSVGRGAVGASVAEPGWEIGQVPEVVAGVGTAAGSRVGQADERATDSAPDSAASAFVPGGTDPVMATGGFPAVGVAPGTGGTAAPGDDSASVAADVGPGLYGHGPGATVVAGAVSGLPVGYADEHGADSAPGSAAGPSIPGGTDPVMATGGFPAVGVAPGTGETAAPRDASASVAAAAGPGAAALSVMNPGFGTAQVPAHPTAPGGVPASAPRAPALAGGLGGPDALGPLLGTVLGALGDGARDRGGPLPAGGPPVVDAAVRRALGGEAVPAHGVGAHEALAALTRVLAYGTTDPADPSCAGHLHCPPLAVAVAADLVASALNPSLDSWDQAPAATALETEVVAALAGLVGFTPGLAAGTVTTGGTESNLLGLLLARDRGGPGVGRHRVLCSDAAHFSVRRSAALLGMGDDAVVPVVTCSDDRIDPSALDAVCRRVVAANDRPTVIVATAGTTDLGAVDPLAACADVAREHGVWLHVDAAYGGGALFSDRLAPLLHGIDRADSVGLDLHKLGWQPVAAGVFLVRDSALFAPLTQRAKYLNPADDEDAGLPSLLGHSPRTTRRADVFKIAVTLRALGRDGLGALVDRCHALARYAGERIDRDPGPGALELTAEPVLTTVVFRYVPHPQPGESPARRADLVNAELRRRLLIEGRAVVGRTEVGTGPGSVRLKLTLLNPHASERDVDALLNAVLDAGRSVEREL